MRKVIVAAAALGLVMSLAACGNQGVNGNNTGSNGQANSGQMDDGSGDTGTRSWAGSSAGTGTGSSVGNDLRRAADGVGDAVEGAMDDMTRAASATTFERMLDNARVRDTDGILTDGENSHW